MVSVWMLYLGNTAYGSGLLFWAFVAGTCTASFYGWLPLYLPELFRTNVRATGQGFGFNFGRILAAVGVLQVGNLLKVFTADWHAGRLDVAARPAAGLLDRRPGLSDRHGDHLARAGNARETAAGVVPMAVHALSERAVHRRILLGWGIGGLLAAALHFGLPLVAPVELPAGGFDLRVSGWGQLIDFAITLVGFELLVRIWELGCDQFAARPWIRRLVFLALLPLLTALLGAWHVRHYHALVVDPEGVTIVGNVSTGPQSFRHDQLDRVVLVRRRWWDELEFRWQGQVQSSVWIYQVDSRAQGGIAPGTGGAAGAGQRRTHVSGLKQKTHSTA